MSDREQMNEKRETVSDIVAEMLERADAMQTHGTTHGVRLAIREFVRRIKAAWKRERANVEIEVDALAVGGIVEAARTTEKSSAVGNAAAMREALHALKEMFRDIDIAHDSLEKEIYELANAALSAPPRNCDVGTAEEQTKRLRENCNKYKPSCKGCKYVTDLQKVNCWLAWAQMPYEAQGGGAR